MYYYRIRQIDVNNNSIYSDIKKAKIDVDGKFTVSINPQPFRNTLQASIDGIEKKNFVIVASISQ